MIPYLLSNCDYIKVFYINSQEFCMRILAIESSCDETSVAVLSDKHQVLNLEFSLVNSQIKEHSKYGGVVPEVAARLHVPNLVKMLSELNEKYDWKDFDYIAVTAGPGLITSLMIGAESAKIIAHLLNRPLVIVNHLTAHLNSVLINKPLSAITFPALGLIVSGGHTELLYLSRLHEYKVLGRTRDDAVGEAYDKVAKLLGLAYPGGPIVSKRAANVDKDYYKFPRPMYDSPNFDFSFSGLKTAILYKTQEYKKLTPRLVDKICYAFQEAVLDVLQHKIMRAAKKYPGVKSLIVAGGVSANQRLREVFQAKFSGFELHFPEFQFCGDNAAMIAVDAYLQIKFQNKAQILNGASDLSRLRPNPNWEINKSIWRR